MEMNMKEVITTIGRKREEYETNTHAPQKHALKKIYAPCRQNP